MAPKKMKTVLWSCVPEEVVFEILLRLPVKSLYRFRCVSKSWFSVISDPKFTSLHSDHSLANPKMLLISEHTYTKYSILDSSYQLVCSVDYAEWGIRKRRGQPRSLVADYHGIIPHNWLLVSRPRNSVVGLCLAKYSDKDCLLICNPSTRESIRFNLPDRHIDDVDYCINNSYLGFDPVEKKHKVLSSWIHGMNPSVRLNYVITLGEDTWRSVECKYSHVISQFQFKSVDISTRHGFIYYLSKVDEIDSQYDLVGFDVRLETFTSISVPLRIPDEVEPILMEYGECVAVVYVRENNTKYARQQVIVMAVLIDNEKWNCEEYTVPREEVRLVSKYYLVGSSPNGELVFVSYIKSNLLKLNCYDLETKHMKDIKVRSSKDKKDTWSNLDRLKVCPHVEMLQSLQGLSPATYHYKRY